MVVTGGCVTTAESHVKRYFDGNVGVAATGIRQAWWGAGEERRSWYL